MHHPPKNLLYEILLFTTKHLKLETRSQTNNSNYRHTPTTDTGHQAPKPLDTPTGHNHTTQSYKDQYKTQPTQYNRSFHIQSAKGRHETGTLHSQLSSVIFVCHGIHHYYSALHPERATFISSRRTATPRSTSRCSRSSYCTSHSPHYHLCGQPAAS